MTELPIISLDVEHFLSYMFGKQTTHGVSDLGGKVWHDYAKKIASHLRKYVEQNVVTTPVHRQRMEVALRKIENARRNPRLREPEMVAGLAELCLLLMGNMPNHWEKKRVGHPAHFRLDTYRTLNYSQTWQQKAALIKDTISQGVDTFSREEQNEMWRRYLEAEGRGDFKRFCGWFQETYPEKYIDLFLG